MAASFLVVPPLLSACIGDGDSNGRSEPQQSVSVGVVSLPLEATAPSGAVYRLVGEFDVMGTTELSISSEDHAGETSINQDLPVGNYTVTLADGWELLLQTEDGEAPASNAALLSAQSQWFSIEDGQVTEVVYAFEVDGETAATGGTLELSVTVQERASSGGEGEGGCAGAGAGGNGPQFELGVAIAVGQRSTPAYAYITAGDLDGDTWPDIALAHAFSSGGIVLNLQDEAFAPEELLSESWWNIEDSIGATSVSLADLDLDGDLDYVFAIYGDHFEGQMIQLYEGDGAGHHAIPSELPSGLVYELDGANPMGTRVADFDHNGLPDIASGTNNGWQSANIILQTSPWVFTPAYAYSQNGYGNPQWPEIGDLNHDGWMDLVAPFLYDYVEVYLNTADGTGSMEYSGSYVPDHHSQVAVADFDGDGFQDIAARSQFENHVDVLHNDGTGAFTSMATFGVSGTGCSDGGSGGSVRTGDINGDGTMDLVVCSNGPSTVDILLNDGSGAFREALPIALDEPPRTMALEDFDQDGDVDVAVYTVTENVGAHLRVLWNRLER